MTNSKNIYPSKKSVALNGKKINFELEPISLTVIILSYKK
jgi:hypothetical protein